MPPGRDSATGSVWIWQHSIAPKRLCRSGARAGTRVVARTATHLMTWFRLREMVVSDTLLRPTLMAKQIEMNKRPGHCKRASMRQCVGAMAARHQWVLGAGRCVV